MNKNALAVGIIFLFIVSSISPIVISNNITSSEIISESTSDGGLMNSSWPMFQYDVHHTGRSHYGKSGNWFIEKWTIDIGSMVFSSPAIDKNGTIYIGSNNWYFYAINPDGTLEWKYKTLDYINPSAAIAKDGIIYIGAHCTSQPDFYSYLYAFEPIDDNAPDIPVIDGLNSGLINIEYNFTVVTSDPDGDNISYYFNWGDGKKSGWTGFVPSGTMVNLSHSWEKSGTYTIKVKAKDDYGMESEWGELQVTMPRDKAVIPSLLQRWIERYPLLNRLLQGLIMR